MVSWKMSRVILFCKKNFSTIGIKISVIRIIFNLNARGGNLAQKNLILGKVYIGIFYIFEILTLENEIRHFFSPRGESIIQFHSLKNSSTAPVCPSARKTHSLN